MKKTIILGSTGMLGAMVFNYLTANPSYCVGGTYRDRVDLQYFPGHKPKFQFNAVGDINTQLSNIYKLFPFEYIINCIGLIKPYCQPDNMGGIEDAIKINALLPHRLINTSVVTSNKIRIIQIATDCVFSGQRGSQTEKDVHDPEDVYGKTKSLGEIIHPNFLNIRCSIIGPELKNFNSLLEWFLRQPGNSPIYGFAHHKWNGITTLQYAKLINEIIRDNRFDELRSLNHTLHYIENESVSKYELLKIINDVFKLQKIITKTNSIGSSIDRTLNSCYLTSKKNSMRTSVLSLRNYMSSSLLYSNNYTL